MQASWGGGGPHFNGDEGREDGGGAVSGVMAKQTRQVRITGLTGGVQSLRERNRPLGAWRDRCGWSCHVHGWGMKSGGDGCGEAAMLPAAQLSKKAGSPEGSMSTGARGLGWAWCEGQCQ